ncbi:unnamed protein product [Caenorhabditis sp. 36 PRJEB53466]|nr:unnamed protein product [Caenorhabditis sp. 36 PRJEB53466]
MTPRQRKSWDRYRPSPPPPSPETLRPYRLPRTHMLFWQVDLPPSFWIEWHAKCFLILWTFYTLSIFYNGADDVIWFQGISLGLPIWYPFVNIAFFGLLAQFPYMCMLTLALFHAVAIGLCCLVQLYNHANFGEEDYQVTDSSYMVIYSCYFWLVSVFQIWIVPQAIRESRKRDAYVQYLFS